jgi:hypothetical protein
MKSHKLLPHLRESYSGTLSLKNIPTVAPASTVPRSARITLVRISQTITQRRPEPENKSHELV